MNKYERCFMFKETIPGKINNFELTLLLFEFKISFAKQHEFAKFKELNNNFCIKCIIRKLHEQNPKTREYLKRILNNINKNTLFKIFIMDSTDLLHAGKMEDLDDVLKSFITSGLVKDARVIMKEKQSIIEITLLNDKKIKYSHIPLERKLTDAYKGHCHNVTSDFMRQLKTEELKVGIVQENNELHGRYYHSFIIKNDVVYDLAHDIIMSCNNYLELFNPNILILDDADKVIKDIQNLELNKSFTDSEYIDILKYAMEKQNIK